MQPRALVLQVSNVALARAHQCHRHSFEAQGSKNGDIEQWLPLHLEVLATSQIFSKADGSSSRSVGICPTLQCLLGAYIDSRQVKCVS